MAVLVSDLYTTVTNVMLEPGGFVLGLVTDQEFLDYFHEALEEWYEKSAIMKTVFTQTLQTGVPQYTVPDDVVNPEEAFVGGVYLNPSSIQELDQYEYAWRRKNGRPTRWRDDAMPPKTMEVFPNPSFTGVAYPPPTAPQVVPGSYGTFAPADRNLTVVGTAGTLKSSFAMGDTIPNVPDTFTVYLGYGIMKRIFRKDGDTKDNQRAAYCEARFLEGVNLCKAFLAQSQARF